MSAGVGYSLGPLTPDQIDFIHVAPVSVLVAAANGEVDLNRLALQELANRGYDRQGNWVGFKRARVDYLAEGAQMQNPAGGDYS
jgi:hypothetical protein